MSDAEIIDRTREALDSALASMRRVWIDTPVDDETLAEAQENARFASELIADLRLQRKRGHAQG